MMARRWIARTESSSSVRLRTGRERNARTTPVGDERRNGPGIVAGRAGARSRRPVRAAVGSRTAVKIAIVVQRYGATINGGAELHARYIAEHLAQHVQVEVLTTCATDYITWRNALPAGTGNGERRHGAAVSGDARARTGRIWPHLGARVHAAPCSSRRIGLARRRRADEPRAVAYIRQHAAALRLFHLLQRSLLPRLSRRARGARQGDPGAHGRTRRRARSGDLRARFSAASAPSCTTPSRNARSFRRSPATLRCPASSSVSARRFPRTATPRDFVRSSTSATASRFTSGASTRTKAVPSCSITSSATAACLPRACTWCSSAIRSFRFPITRRFTISGSSATRTSSTRWRRRNCSSCRRISKACRWWRSKRGRLASRCSPTAAATC